MLYPTIVSSTSYYVYCLPNCESGVNVKALCDRNCIFVLKHYTRVLNQYRLLQLNLNLPLKLPIKIFCVSSPGCINFSRTFCSFVQPDSCHPQDNSDQLIFITYSFHSNYAATQFIKKKHIEPKSGI